MRNQNVLMPACSGTFLVFSGAAVVKNVAKKMCFLSFMLDRSSNHLGWLTTSDLIVWGQFHNSCIKKNLFGWVMPENSAKSFKYQNLLCSFCSLSRKNASKRIMFKKIRVPQKFFPIIFVLNFGSKPFENWFFRNYFIDFSWKMHGFFWIDKRA